MEATEFLGITKLTALILRKNFKHFLCIAFLWVIPTYAFHLRVLDVSFFALDTLVGFSLWIYRLIFSREHLPSSPPAPNYHDSADHNLHPTSWFFYIASFFFSVTISLISYPLLTFSVCRTCLNKTVWLKGSLLGVLRSARNVVLTSLCVGATVLGFNFVTLGITGIVAGVVVAVSGNDPTTVAIVMSCIAIAVGVGGVYLTVLFSLAHTAAILEEKTRGWRAMRRSIDLLNGKKWLALQLVCVFYALLEPCKLSELWRWRGAQIVRVSLQTVIELFGVAANVVLFMSCKSYKEEPLSKLVAASAQFGPDASSPKWQAMDVETASFLLTLPN